MTGSFRNHGSPSAGNFWADSALNCAIGVSGGKVRKAKRYYLEPLAKYFSGIYNNLC